jgi:hypothetical protein
MNKKLTLRLLKLLSALEAYSFSVSEKFMPDYLHDELVTLLDDLESIVLDNALTARKYNEVEYTNPHKHNDF